MGNSLRYFESSHQKDGTTRGTKTRAEVVSGSSHHDSRINVSAWRAISRGGEPD